MLVTTNTPAQSNKRILNERVTLIAANVKIRDVFKAIHKQTGFTVLYGNAMLNDQEKISVIIKELFPIDAVAYVLRGKHLESSYAENGSQSKIIIISRETTKDNVPSNSASKPTSDTVLLFPKVTGKVTDASGNPIIGATILIKGTNQGTTTNAKGDFELHNLKVNNTILISYIGYETRELLVKGKSILVPLSLDVQSLDEAVVIAYGKSTKRMLTSNVVSVKAKDIEKQPVINPLSALQGRVTGMVITQNTGVPGGGFTVQIRGQNSIRPEGNDPLYVVDGVPYSSTLLPSYSNIILNGNPLNYINISDIESIDVLKDADATAIYGSRGANGVVLISTKQGKPGKAKLDFNIYTGGGRILKKVNLLSTPQYLEMRREAFKNDGAMPNEFSAPDLVSWDTTRYTNWQKELIGRTSTITNAQASLSGGNTSMQYIIGTGFHKETTVFPGDFSDEKKSVHFKISQVSLNKKIRVFLSGNYVNDINRLPNSDFTNFSITLPPNAPNPYNSDGSLNWSNYSWDNPYSYLKWKHRIVTKNLLSNAGVSYDITSNLSLKTSFGYTNMMLDEVNTRPAESINPVYGITTGSSTFTSNNIESWIIEPQISYSAMIEGGEVNFLLGTTIQQNDLDGRIIYADGYTNDGLLENPQAASKLNVISFTNTKYKYNAFFGRINYNFRRKYLFNLTFRRDGSSRFGPGKQFANFGAVGIGWIFSNEPFVQRTLPFLSFGKLRGSYGSTGNDQIGDYQYLDLYNSTLYPYQSTQGLFPNNLFNDNFRWEVNKKLELAAEFGFLKDRIYSSVSYYRNRSSNQLIGRPIPAITGFTSVSANLTALVQNKGLEIILNTTNISSKSFSWNTSFNLTIPNNKLIAFPGLENSAYQNRYVIGKSLSVIKAYEFMGVDENTGVYVFKDSKGNVTTDPDYVTDRISNVDLAPRYYGGFSNTFQYNGLQVDFLLQFVKQNGTQYLYNFIPGYLGNQPVTVLDRWKGPGGNSQIQRFSQDFSLYTAYSYAQSSDQIYDDASFIRLKNVSISYLLSPKLVQKFRVGSCRIYVQGQNLLTFTKYKGLDPESQNVYSLPPLRVITAGIQITL